MRIFLNISDVLQKQNRRAQGCPAAAVSFIFIE
ncbi:MAG: hypothetical protein ACI91Z_001887 [Yoonia sp.]